MRAGSAGNGDRDGDRDAEQCGAQDSVAAPAAVATKKKVFSAPRWDPGGRRVPRAKVQFDMGDSKGRPGWAHRPEGSERGHRLWQQQGFRSYQEWNSCAIKSLQSMNYN